MWWFSVRIEATPPAMNIVKDAWNGQSHAAKTAKGSRFPAQVKVRRPFLFQKSGCLVLLPSVSILGWVESPRAGSLARWLVG